MKQKILLFCIAMMATCYSFATTGTYNNGGVVYTYDTKDNTASVTNFDKNELPANVTILSSIVVGETSYTVTSIGYNAFGGCSNLQTVAFQSPSALKSIGDNAFQSCSALTSVTIPNTVTSIGENTFNDCSKLTAVTFQDVSTLKSIGNNAFGGCILLPSIIIPDGVTYIGDNAFMECSVLASVTIPNTVTSIGSYAFSGCEALPSISIPDDVSSIGYHAFSDCTSLTSFTIPSSVTSININTFSGCIALASITIPSNINSIGDNAFNGCKALTSITIPNSVNSIGNSAFNGCTNLKTIFLPVKSTAIQLGTDVFTGTSTSLIFYVLDGTGNADNKKLYTGNTNWSTFATATNTFFAYQKTVTDAGVATLYLPYDVDIPNGVKAYYCSGTDKSSYLSMKQLTGTASASTPLYLEAAAGTYTFLGNNNGTQTSTPTDMNPILKGSTKELTYVENTYLTLGQKAGDTKYGFYLYQNASKTAIPANVCHILKSEYIPDGSAKGLDISFNDTPTSISTATMGNGANAEAKIYDLQGRRVTSSHPTKGLYIVNGKKMIIK